MVEKGPFQTRSISTTPNAATQIPRMRGSMRSASAPSATVATVAMSTAEPNITSSWGVESHNSAATWPRGRSTWSSQLESTKVIVAAMTTSPSRNDCSRVSPSSRLYTLRRSALTATTIPTTSNPADMRRRAGVSAAGQIPSKSATSCPTAQSPRASASERLTTQPARSPLDRVIATARAPTAGTTVHCTSNTSRPQLPGLIHSNGTPIAVSPRATSISVGANPAGWVTGRPDAPTPDSDSTSGRARRATAGPTAGRFTRRCLPRPTRFWWIAPAWPAASISTRSWNARSAVLRGV